MKFGIKLGKLFKKGFDSEPVHKEKYLITKIKSYEGKIRTNVYDNKMPKKSSQYISLSPILINSVFRTGKNYYPQVFLEQCKEKKMPKFITDNVKISDDSDEEENSGENNYSKEKNSFLREKILKCIFEKAIF